MRDIIGAVRTLRLVAAGNLPPQWIPHLGLCTNLTEHCLGADTLHRIFSSWPEYSGCTSYPVPASPDALHGRSLDKTERAVAGAQLVYWGCLDMYKGTYGASRRRLAAYMADVLEREYL